MKAEFTEDKAYTYLCVKAMPEMVLGRAMTHALGEAMWQSLKWVGARQYSHRPPVDPV